MGLGLIVATLGLAAAVAVWGRRLFAFLRQLYHVRKHISRLPCAPRTPLLGNILQMPLDRVAFGTEMEKLSFAHSKDGVMAIWIGPVPVVILFSGPAIEPLLSSSDNITKAAIGYTYLKKWLGDGLLLSTGTKWRSRRKMLTPTFHYGILQGFVDIQAVLADKFADILRPHAEDEEPFDIFPAIGRCALDIICESAMGVNVGAQDEMDSDYVKATIQMTQEAFLRERSPWYWSDSLYRLLGRGVTWDENVALTSGFTRKVIRERKASLEAQAAAKGVALKELKLEGQRLAFLDLLILMQAESGQLSDEDIKDEVDVFMFEGHDTTSSGIGWALFMLGHHPEIQDSVAEEQRAIFGTDMRPATSDDLKEMKYLERVIKESQRLYPSVPIYARNVTKTFTINTANDQYTIPEGTNCCVVPFYLHRSVQTWGVDVMKFNPDRFLPSNTVDRHPFDYLPFSAGPRNCVGQRFAMMEEQAVISRVIREFVVESLESRRKVRATPDLVLRPPSRFLVRLSRRLP